MESSETKTLAHYRLQLAEEAWQDTVLLFQHQRYRICMSRCYYTVFYASQALLLLKGLSFKKHSANLSAFQQTFAKENIFPRNLSKAFNKLFLKRQEADYEDMIVFTPEEIEMAINDAKAFLDEAKQLFQKLVETP